MRKKKCRCCRRWYLPQAQTYRQQKTCNKASCRAWRKRQAPKAWRLRNPLYSESGRVKQKQWRQKHLGYWRAWRKAHPGYVERNRKTQKNRNAKNRGLIAKRNEWNAICIEKLRGIALLRLIAKENEWKETIFHQIDGLCRYLEGQLMIAK